MEPTSWPDWQKRLWRNRPCCFLHFEVFRRPASRAHIPGHARQAVVGGRRGLLANATTYGRFGRGGDYLYYANHTRFLWREHGVHYVASLHRFGTPAETRALLGRIVRSLRPVRALVDESGIIRAPPYEAVAPVRLVALPEAARRTCRDLQRRAAFPVLCQRRVPAPTLGLRIGDRPQRLHVASTHAASLGGQEDNGPPAPPRAHD